MTSKEFIHLLDLCLNTVFPELTKAFNCSSLNLIEMNAMRKINAFLYNNLF